MTPADLNAVHVVLVRPQQPGNIGTVARAIANHGLGPLILVDPPGFDPDLARWMAPEAHHIINRARFVATVRDAVADMSVVIGTSARPRKWDWPVYTPAQLSQQIDPRPTAIVFGPEDAGLSNDDLSLCQALITIPTTAHKSLNLGQAVTVIAAALRQGALPSPPPPAPTAPLSLQLHAVQILMQILDGSDYLRGKSDEQVQGTLLRLLGRAQPTQKEATALLGMLNKMARRMRITVEDTD
ncbi:MAG: TrmH family RNA methyltransferase [Myxococcota bacterium]